MTVSHSSELINIHIISHDNLRRFQTRQSFSVKDSAVQMCIISQKVSLNFISLGVEDLVDDYVRHLFAFDSNYNPDGFLPFVVRHLIKCVCILCVCVLPVQMSRPGNSLGHR